MRHGAGGPGGGAHGIDGAQTGTITALVGLALVAVTVRMIFKNPMIAVACVIAAFMLAVMFKTVFGTLDLIANPFLGLIVIAVGGCIGNASRKHDKK